MKNDDPDSCGALAIDLAEPCPLWRETLGDVEAICGAAARAALNGANAAPPSASELSIVLGDDALVQSLNRRWRGKDEPTNVLSFPAQGGERPPEAPLLLGDVVLAYERVAQEAAAQGKPLIDHLRHLVVHGVLHLIGFDHEVPAEAEQMEALEAAVLAGLGVPDPYRAADAAPGASHG
jgi:probable rRNA maturation factor